MGRFHAQLHDLACKITREWGVAAAAYAFECSCIYGVRGGFYRCDVHMKAVHA